jgi:hypothetical protein
MLMKEREGRSEVMGRWKRRHKQIIDNPKEKIGYWKLEREACDCPLWITEFGRGFGPVIRQTIERMNELEKHD